MADQSLTDQRPIQVASRSSRIVMVLTVGALSLAVLIVVFLFVYADPSGNSLSFGASEKICQVTGKNDWDTHDDIAARTGANLAFGFTGTDGGYPVEHNSALHPNGMALFFGDSRFNPPRGDNKNPEALPDDAIGWVSTQTPPTMDRCLGSMTINPKSPAVGPPAIKQGLFNTPTGGVSTNGFLYGFFWTDHCLEPLNPAKCPDSDLLNKWGHGVLARSKNDGETFVDPVPMPRDFVLSTAVDSEAVVGLPPEQRLGIYVFGVPHYRDSVPYLAYAPPGAISDPSLWMFFIGRKPDGQPSWTTREVWERRARDAPPPGHPDLFDASGCDRHIGEISVTWNRYLHAWLLLYQNCNPSGGGQVVVARVAAAPWGPWSDASILLDPNRDNPWCHLLWRVPSRGRCDDLHIDDWSQDPDKAGKENGDFYAPYVMERYTTPERTFLPYRRRATIYWLLSTWNPYQVVVMKTSLTIDGSATVRVVNGIRSVFDGK